MIDSLFGQVRWRSAVWAALAAVVVAALVNGVASQRWHRYRERTTQSEVVLETLAAVRAHLVDAETGQRGYLLTGSDDYLDPFRTATAQLRTDLSRLEALGRDSELPQQAVDRLLVLSGEKMRELDTTIVLRQTNRAGDAVTIVRSDRGRVLMDSLRTLTGVLAAAENARLTTRRSDEGRSGNIVLAALLVGAAVTLGILIYLQRTLSEYDRTQRAACREMERQITDLEALARERFPKTAAAATRPPERCE